MTSEPLFPLPPGSHRIYVRCVELPWPHTGVGLQAVCRRCAWSSPHLRTFYDGAWEDGWRHAQEADDAAGDPWDGVYGPY